ncbi:MAG: glycine oxidase ThiO [Chloroflexota bacterium]
MPTTADVIIIGGGVIGCSVAYHLARAGVNVTVIERTGIASGASGVAAGMLTAVPEHVQKGPQYELAVASLKLFPDTLKAVHEASGIDPEYIQAGTMRVAFTEEEEAALKANLPNVKSVIEADWVPGDDVRQTEPLLSSEIRGAVYTPGERQVRSARLTQAYAQAAGHHRARYQIGQMVIGLTWQGNRVTGVRLGDGSHLSSDHVVIAAGPWSGFLTEDLGVTIPVRPVRGQILSIHRMPRPLTMCIYHNHEYLTPKVDGTVLVGATYEEAGFDLRVTTQAVHDLLGFVPRLVPELADAQVTELRVGLRPGSPDDAPMLGPVPGWEGLSVATGHFRSGILLSPITGLLIAESITQGTTSMPLEPFSLARFG